MMDVPQELTKGVKISTIIHIGILLFFVVSPLLFRHKYKNFRPTVHSVELVSLPGTNLQSGSTAARPEIKTEAPVKPKHEAKPLIETKPKPEIKKPAMTIPSAKPVKTEPIKEKTPSLEERLSKRLEKIKKNPDKEWEEPVQKAKVKTLEKNRQSSTKSASVSGAFGVSGTMGVSAQSDFPFQYYLETIHGKISSCWNNPEMVLDKQYYAVISFTITRSGDVLNTVVKKSSGIPNFDQSCAQAVETAKPFPELPPGYRDNKLTINVEFNLEQ